MSKKRTFGQLKEGSYFGEAGVGCVTRRSVASINYNPGGGIWTGKVRIGIGYNIDKFAYVDSDATEFSNPAHHWFIDKQDARKCAYQLLIKGIREKEKQLDWLKFRARSFRENFLPDEPPQEQDDVLTRINRKVHSELEKQKSEGKKFLSDEDIDEVISKVLAEKKY